MKKSAITGDARSDAGEITQYELLLASGPDSGRIIPLTGRKQTLGRSPSCGIRIDDAGLQPHHVVISNVESSASSGLQLESVVQPLGGTAEIRSSTFRVGATECWVQRSISDDIINRPSAATRPFHRPPQLPIDEKDPPTEPQNPAQPTPTSAPPWGAISGGVATGLLVAAITGQLLFGVFSLVTAGIAGMTWVIQRGGYRRALRRWSAVVQRNANIFDEECLSFARHLAERRRLRHRPLGALLLAAHTGESDLWAKREIDDVCIGFGSRQVAVTPHARPLAFNDIPVTLSFAPGSVIGIHGPRSIAVSTAILVRLAVEVGPSDWRLLVADELPASWNHLRDIPNLRARPLSRNDLDHAGDHSFHDVVLITEVDQVAHRNSVPLRYVGSHRATLLVCSPTRRDLPALCTDIIDSINSELDGVGSEGARNFISALRQWHDPDAQISAIPDQVRLEDLASIGELDLQSLRQRWLSQSVHFDLGLSAEGPISLDLAADGPHMIVVGTTGSGKSELLRSLVTSLAIQASPLEVNFILLDYKGGSAFDACVHLPHVVGVVTDLDHDEGNQKIVTRVLRGLESELRRREHILRRAALSDQQAYQRQRRPEDEPMPRLIVVVDELAALRADIPESVSALIAIAQRGRSFGLHLVLATQRPGTELTPDVMANSSIRLALRLQTREDSLQVIGHPRAADLPRQLPGRALLSLGSERSEEFQSLFVSQDLMAVVALTSTLARDLNIESPRRPWCPPLATRLRPSADREYFAVGLIDDPDTQQQIPLLWEPQRHLLLTMGSGLGKTWILHTLAAISQHDDPTARLFFLSGGGHRKPESGWIAVSDRERMHRLLHYLIGMIEDRRSQQRGNDRITLMIDDVDLWRSHHSDDRVGSMQWDLFERIVIEGPTVGVVCVMTTSATQLLPTAMKSRIEQHWQAGTRPGSVLVGSPMSRQSLFAQIYDPGAFADDLEQLIDVAVTDRHLVMATLPLQLRSDDRRERGSFGVRADSLTEETLDPTQTLCHLILGYRRSGRTTVLTALVEAWKDLHPEGVILRGHELDDATALLAALENDEDEGAILLAIDDADRRTLCEPLCDLIKKALDSPRAGINSRVAQISVVASASVTGVRSHPEHWLHVLRRSRSGVLLGRCSEEDGDLFGQYARHLNIVPQSTARGMWIDNGEPMGVIQFFDLTRNQDGDRDD